MKLIFFINCHQVSLRLLFKNSFFKQLQLVLTQLIIMHAMSASLILGFKQFDQHILPVLFAMNFSGSKFDFVI